MSRGGKREGAGRKPAPPRVAITVRVDDQIAARFNAMCADNDESQSSVFTKYVQAAFTKWMRKLIKSNSPNE